VGNYRRNGGADFFARYSIAQKNWGDRFGCANFLLDKATGRARVKPGFDRSPARRGGLVPGSP